MHGLARIITGVGGFADKMTAAFDGGLLPMPMVHGFLVVLPFIELAIGALIVLGLGMRYALVAGGFLITALTFGSTAKQDWGAAGTQLPYAIAFFILLFTREYNRICVDKITVR